MPDTRRFVGDPLVAQEVSEAKTHEGPCDDRHRSARCGGDHADTKYPRQLIRCGMQCILHRTNAVGRETAHGEDHEADGPSRRVELGVTGDEVVEGRSDPCAESQREGQKPEYDEEPNVRLPKRGHDADEREN